MVNPETPEAAILRAIVRLGDINTGDVEGEHINRDAILLDLLDVLAPEVAAIAREREEEIRGYWYA